MTAPSPIALVLLREPGPLQEQTTRYRCPHCRRSYAHQTPAAKHMLRCFSSPFTRACKSCKHYDWDEDGFQCAQGVYLDRARCPACGDEVDQGEGYCPAEHFEKPVYGLRVQCDLWEATDA